VHKKAQENFERRTHRRVIKVWDSDRGVVDLWLRYLRKNGIGGVGMKAYVHEWVEYGYGAKEIGELEKQLDRPGQEVEKVAEELVKALSADVDVGEAPGKGGEMVKADGQELVEGPDDVVAGEELPSSNPEGRAESLPNKQPEVKDVGEPPKP
jgi:small subunit ribosomal protein S10